jgi:hypothetical protein
LKLETESHKAMEYSCIVNGQILRVHQIQKNNPPNVIKKSTHGKKINPPNVTLAGSKRGETETANALI